MTTIATPPESVTVQERNTIGIVAFTLALFGAVFAVVPGALILGWITLPIAFILSLVGLFPQGKKKGFAVAGLIVSVVGTIIGILFSVFGFLYILSS